MGIFMITISQISSHTIVESIPALLSLPRRPPAFGAASSRPVRSYCVISKVARRILLCDPARVAIRTGSPASDLVHLRVAALVDADPVRAGNRARPTRRRAAVPLRSRQLTSSRGSSMPPPSARPPNTVPHQGGGRSPAGSAPPSQA